MNLPNIAAKARYNEKSLRIIYEKLKDYSSENATGRDLETYCRRAGQPSGTGIRL
ncbi:hypothetical protein BNJ_00328 [Kaumoebavirus]|uniref:hypothetical protein n=1 Tax=Kaumoebavirus TaxID=1859492 RepID=UPI0009C30F06|nr:hypothetical protein BNJ_00328 [Kaumoebavirus]ARA72149.1 hypothetical protein BNJ_00328 [Kaumoebavirus]